MYIYLCYTNTPILLTLNLYCYLEYFLYFSILILCMYPFNWIINEVKIQYFSARGYGLIMSTEHIDIDNIMST